jgi:hypothetical protein
MSWFSDFFHNLFPVYVPQYGNFPQYSFWNVSFLMYLMIFITAIALAAVTLMDEESNNPSPALLGGKDTKKKIKKTN